jgi:hypothetical protein
MMYTIRSLYDNIFSIFNVLHCFLVSFISNAQVFDQGVDINHGKLNVEGKDILRKAEKEITHNGRHRRT